MYIQSNSKKGLLMTCPGLHFFSIKSLSQSFPDSIPSFKATKGRLSPILPTWSIKRRPFNDLPRSPLFLRYRPFKDLTALTRIWPLCPTRIFKVDLLNTFPISRYFFTFTLLGAFPSTGSTFNPLWLDFDQYYPLDLRTESFNDLLRSPLLLQHGLFRSMP